MIEYSPTPSLLAVRHFCLGALLEPNWVGLVRPLGSDAPCNSVLHFVYSPSCVRAWFHLVTWALLDFYVFYLASNDLLEVLIIGSPWHLRPSHVCNLLDYKTNTCKLISPTWYCFSSNTKIQTKWAKGPFSLQGHVVAYIFRSKDTGLDKSLLMLALVFFVF